MARHERPREIIEHCLEPLRLNGQSPAAQEAVRRLVDAFGTLQPDPGAQHTRSTDLSARPAIVINEAAHGYDA